MNPSAIVNSLRVVNLLRIGFLARRGPLGKPSRNANGSYAPNSASWGLAGGL